VTALFFGGAVALALEAGVVAEGVAVVVGVGPRYAVTPLGIGLGKLAAEAP
jgi:hypothetical protein